MDSQGFMSQNFSSAPAERGIAALGREEKNGVRGVATNEIHDAEGLGKPKPKQGIFLNVMQGVNSFGNSLWMIGWMTFPGFPIPLPVFPAAAWIFKMIGWKSGHAAAEAALKGATAALHDVTLANIQHMPSTFLNTAANVVSGSGGNIAPQGAKLAAAATAVDARMSAMATGTSKRVQPLVRGFSSTLERAGKSRLGTKVTQLIEPLVKNKIAKHVARQPVTHAAAIAEFSVQPRGFIEYIMRKPKPAVEMPAAFGEALGHTHAGTADGYKAAIDALKKVAAEDSGLQSHAESIVRELNRALGSVTKVAHYQEALTGGVSSFVKNVVKGVGQKSVFTAAIVAAVVAGGGVAYLTAKNDNHDAKKALDGLARDVGDAKHPLVIAAKQRMHMQAGGRYIGAAASTGADSMMITGDMSMLVPQMGAMAAAQGIQQLIVGENAILDAYHKLCLADKGELKLEPAERIHCYKQLIAGLPSVPKKEGIYNKMVTPAAVAVAERNLNVHEAVRLITDTPKFNALLKEVAEQQEAAKAKATAAAALPEHGEKPVSANDNTHTANDNSPDGRLAKAEAAYAAQEKPSNIIARGADKEDGMVAEQQMAVGKK